jgi:excisionase family DNA binding protein
MQLRESTKASVSRLLTVQELADLLQVPLKTIYTWRYKGTGPPAVPVGKYLRFRPEDVAAWLDARADPVSSDAQRDAPRPGGSRIGVGQAMSCGRAGGRNRS